MPFFVSGTVLDSKDTAVNRQRFPSPGICYRRRKIKTGKQINKQDRVRSRGESSAEHLESSGACLLWALLWEGPLERLELRHERLGQPAPKCRRGFRQGQRGQRP